MFFLYYKVLGPYKVTIILAQALNWNMDFSPSNSPPLCLKLVYLWMAMMLGFWARSVLIIWSEVRVGEGAV